MRNHKIHRFGSLLALFLLLSCLLTVSTFAGDYDRWGYQHLNVSQKRLYDKIEEAVAAKDPKTLTIIDGYPKDNDWTPALDVSDCQIADTDVSETIRMFIADCPQYFWFTGSVNYATFSDGTVAYLFNFHYINEDARVREFEEAAEEVLKDLDKTASAYEKALYIHDQLVNLITYDLAYAYDQSAYSALMAGRAVCAGYARAYQYLLNKVGIDAWTVEGYSGDYQNKEPELEPHAWTLLWIDDVCVYTDVTWDDQAERGLFHSYFNRCLSELSEDHVTYIPDGYYYAVGENNTLHCVSEEEYRERGTFLGVTDYDNLFHDKLPDCKVSHEEKSYFAKKEIPVIMELSDDAYVTFANAGVKTDDSYFITILCESYDQSAFHEWFDVNKLAEQLPDDILNRWVSTTYIGFNGEVHVTLKLTPAENDDPEQPGEGGGDDPIQSEDPYDGLNDFDGYVAAVENNKITAYVSYVGKELEDDTYSVWVAYYQDGMFTGIDMVTMELEDGRAELTANCPENFGKCVVFVVGDNSNPAPLCDFLHLNLSR